MSEIKFKTDIVVHLEGDITDLLGFDKYDEVRRKIRIALGLKENQLWFEFPFHKTIVEEELPTQTGGLNGNK